MNAIHRFLHKSRPIGPPIAGVQVRVHRTCWPLLPLLVLLPPVWVAPAAGRHIVAAVASFALLVLAIFGHVAASVCLARRFGGKPSTVLLFPFGPLLAEGVASLTVGAKLAIWLAGPLVVWVGGSLLTSSPVLLLDAGGQWLAAYGLFSLVPCYPLAGGMVARELLCLTGSDDTASDRRTLEISRVSLCVLAILALLNAALPLLYALFVLWTVSHLALLPGIDLAGVKVASLRWLRERWLWLHQQLKRNVPCLILMAIFWSNTVWTVGAGDSRGPHPESTTNREASSAGLMETNILRLTAAMADLARQLERTTGHVAALESACQRIEQDVGRTASRLRAVEETLVASSRAADEKIERAWEKSAISIQQVVKEQRQIASAHHQLSSRVATAEASMARLQRQWQSVARDGETILRNLRTLEAQTDQALAVRDQKLRRIACVLTGLTVIGMAALTVAAGYVHRRMEWVTTLMKNARAPHSFAPGCLTLNTADYSTSRERPKSDPKSPSVEKALGVGHAAPSTISSPLNAVVDQPPRPKVGDSCSGESKQPGKSILARPTPEPAILLRRLIAVAQRSRRIRSKPSTGQLGHWTIGCATSKGPVRPKNEDYAVAFEIADFQVVLVADGVSGEPFAGPAAYLAIQSAAWSVMKQVGAARLWQRPDPVTVASQALQMAANGLSRIAAGCGCVAGLRTTLIVVVATRKSYGYAYIGDGKGCILRATGRAEAFLIPQRDAADAACVIAACLGPKQLGSPVTGTLPRLPGDLLIVGTDGAFSESVELGDDYPKRLLRAAFHFRGDLQRTVDHVLQELGSMQDKFGFLFDDNLTLALAADGKPPRLAPGFWSPTGSSETSQTLLGETGQPAIRRES